MTSALMALIAVLVAGFLLRAPIGFSMIASGVAYLAVKGQDLGMVSEQILNGLYNSYVLLAVPLFILAANIMNAGTVSAAALSGMAVVLSFDSPRSAMSMQLLTCWARFGFQMASNSGRARTKSTAVVSMFR